MNFKLSEVLKQARIDKNMTQKQVAVAIGIELNAYQNYEYDKRKPRGDILMKLIRVLDLDPEEVEKALNNT